MVHLSSFLELHQILPKIHFFHLLRKQLPFQLAFPITINKSQGQGYQNLVLYIRKLLFSHSELYVELSKEKNPKKIFIQNALEDPSSLKNIV